MPVPEVPAWMLAPSALIGALIAIDNHIKPKIKRWKRATQKPVFGGGLCIKLDEPPDKFGLR